MFKELRHFLALIIILGATAVYAQIPAGFVQTTATVPSLANGTYGAVWTNLSSATQLPLLGGVSTFQTTVNGQFDSNGHMSVLLADTAQIIPTPSTWTLQLNFLCPGSPINGGFSIQVAVTGGGGTEDITSQINAALPTNPCGGASPAANAVLRNLTNTQTMLGPLISPALNKIYYADSSAYANYQAALTAASAAGGGTVIVPANVIHSEQLTIPSNVTLECANRTSVLTQPNGSNGVVITWANSSTNMAIRNCTIDGNASGQSGNSYGIKAVGVDGLTLDNVQVQNTVKDGMRIDGTSDGLTRVKHVTVENSYFHDNGLTTGLNNIWLLEYLDNIKIFHNKFANWNFDAVSLSETNNDTQTGVWITDNYFDNTSGDSTEFAIETVKRADGVHISRNTMNGTKTGVSVQVLDSEITDNTWIGTGSGDQHTGLELVPTNTTISGNSISNGLIAITNISAYSLNSSNDVIANNSISNSSAASGCLNLGASDHIQVVGNVCNMTGSTSSYAGFWLGFYGSSQQINFIDVLDNKIYYTGGPGSDLRPGITLNAAASSSDITINDNKIYGFYYGVTVAATTNQTEVSIIRNDARGNTNPVLSFATGGVFRIYNNITANGQTYPIFDQGLQIETGTAFTDNQGNGAKAQHSTGSTTTSHIVSYDANGNAIDSTHNLNELPTYSTPGTAQVVCYKTLGPPIQFGVCASIVSSGGGCTCN